MRGPLRRWSQENLNELISLRREGQCWNIVVTEELSAIARGLGQFDAESGLARMLSVACSRLP